ncbi:Rossmann-like and DUF2520 domain-containing protein [Dehalococcoides mccartyi]|jgi:predicted short-subunit dehydrogenase-like oxidoreductase (DUF2520 family)|uniref:Rossmann-like and DUF2520 domain-containing protein n=1 Tax=Dehalococcoides mccartyi TaxID=61435 RepID=UPI000A8635B3|nr:DUF2520 domain-containing protein [Dehalococcoides mccartyi]
MGEVLVQNIGFIGAGRVGSTLALGLSQRGYLISGIASRTPGPAEKLCQKLCAAKFCLQSQEVADTTDIVFITTPDDAIAEVCRSTGWHPGKYVIHCSGAYSADLLQSAKDFGAYTGVLHPLQSFNLQADPVKNLEGITYALEGDDQTLSVLKDMVKALGGKWIVLKPADKPSYHLAAVMASNYLVTLMKMAAQLWQTFGVPEDRAIKALMPLVRGTLSNIEKAGVTDALSGPIDRGDYGTVLKHMANLANTAPELLPVYKELGRQTVKIALDKENPNLAGIEKVSAILAN